MKIHEEEGNSRKQGAEIGEPEIVGDDNEEVRPLPCALAGHEKPARSAAPWTVIFSPLT